MKGLVFTGLEHHGARLNPLLRRARAQGHTIETITGDNPWASLATDFEAVAGDQGLSARFFSEFAEEAAPALRSLRVEAARVWRAAFAEGHPPPTGLSAQRAGFSIEEWLELRARGDAALRALAPDYVLVLHQRNFWARPLVACAEAMGIPSFSFQEGLFLDVYPPEAFREHSALGDRVFLWGPADVERLASVSTRREHLQAVGAMHLEAAFARGAGGSAARAVTRRSLGVEGDAPLVVLVAAADGAGGVRSEEMTALATAIAAIPGARLGIKWRPLQQAEGRALDARSLLGTRLVEWTDADPYDCVLAADLVVGHSTSLLAEAVALGTRVADLDFGAQGRGALDLCAQGVAPALHCAQDFRALRGWLEGAWPSECLQAAERYREQRFALPWDEAPTARVLATIESIVASARAQPIIGNMQ